MSHAFGLQMRKCHMPLVCMCGMPCARSRQAWGCLQVRAFQYANVRWGCAERMLVGSMQGSAVRRVLVGSMQGSTFRLEGSPQARDGTILQLDIDDPL
eukprot:scaffold5155_cov17-Tisochrysis_lutea.AAC.1